MRNASGLDVAEGHRSRVVAETLCVQLQQSRLAQDDDVVREVADHLLRDEYDQFRASTRRDHVETVEAHEELFLLGDLVGISECVGRDDDVTLLPLEPLHRVDRFADGFCQLTRRAEYMEEPRHDESLLRTVRRYDADRLPEEVDRRVCDRRGRDRLTGPCVPLVAKLIGHLPVEEQEH